MKHGNTHHEGPKHKGMSKSLSKPIKLSDANTITPMKKGRDNAK